MQSHKNGRLDNNPRKLRNAKYKNKNRKRCRAACPTSRLERCRVRSGEGEAVFEGQRERSFLFQSFATKPRTNLNPTLQTKPYPLLPPPQILNPQTPQPTQNPFDHTLINQTHSRPGPHHVPLPVPHPALLYATGPLTEHARGRRARFRPQLQGMRDWWWLVVMFCFWLFRLSVFAVCCFVRPFCCLLLILKLWCSGHKDKTKPRPATSEPYTTSEPINPNPNQTLKPKKGPRRRLPLHLAPPARAAGARIARGAAALAV